MANITEKDVPSNNGDVDINDNPEDLRQMGNHQFAQGNFEVASALYTRALELIGQEYCVEAAEPASGNKAEDMPPPPTSLLLNLCNRSACYYQMEMYEEAKKDAEMAWNYVPQLNNIKAAYRLAKTLIALEKFEEGKEVIMQVFTVLDEVDAEAKKKAEREKMERLEQEDHLRGNDEKNKDDKEEESEDDISDTHRKAFNELLKTLEKKQKNQGKEPPKVSIRDFEMAEELGFGNFSEIYRVTHKQTKREFALKRINKKKASDLASRQQ